MNLEEYQLLTSRTNTDLGSPAINAAHVTLGIVGEYGELMKEYFQDDNISDTIKEGGDVMWYTSELANIFFIKLQAIPFMDENNKRVFAGASTEILAENIKKYLAYNKEPDRELVKRHLNNIVYDVTEMCEDLGMTLADCLVTNIEKLRKRFPEKFDAVLAMQQNDMK